MIGAIGNLFDWFRGDRARSMLDALWILGPSACGILFWLRPLRMQLVQPDSIGYIAGHWSRPAGYPRVLAGLVHLGFDPSDVVPLQLAALVAAATFLGYAIRRATGSAFLAAVGALSIAANLGLMRWAFTILTESFTTAAIATFVAAVLLHGCTGRARWLLFAGAALAFAVSLRYAAAGVMLALAVPIAFGRGVWMRRAAFSVAGVAIVFAIFTVAAPADMFSSRRTDQDLSPGHLNVLGVIGLWAEEGDSVRQPEFVDALARRLAPYRDVRLRMPDWRDQLTLDMWTGEYIRYGILQTIADRLQGPPDDAIQAAMIDIVEKHPDKYLRHILVQAVSFWTLPEIRTTQELDALRLHDLPEEFKIDAPSAPLAVILLRRALYLLCLVASIWLMFRIVLTGRRRGTVDAALLGGATAAIAAHGLLLLPVVVHFAYQRYAVPPWPAIISCLILGLSVWQPSKAR